ncbi:hypothetical protein Tco_1207743 [Tanacetum coccineum]
MTRGELMNVEEVNGGVREEPDFSMIIAQQLQNLLPVILAQEKVRNVLVHSNQIEKMESVQDMSSCSIDQKMKYTAGSFVVKALTWWNTLIGTLSQEIAVSMSWNDFKFMIIDKFCPSHEMQKLETELWNHIRGMVAAMEPKTMKKVMQISGALTDEAIRNGSIKKFEKRGNVGEPSKDKNGMDDNKRTRTRNAFATTANPVGRENTTCNSYHAPGGPCRTCFNCNCPGHLLRIIDLCLEM